MSFLGNDITFCTNKECTIRKNCGRKLTKNQRDDLVSQTRFDQNEDGTCDHLIDISSTKDKK
jgi:hypothetical protein